MELNEIYDKAEEMAEQNLCEKGCLCPIWKEKGFCCDCSVFFGLREYYKELLEEQEQKEYE